MTVVKLTRLTGFISTYSYKIFVVTNTTIFNILVQYKFLEYLGMFGRVLSFFSVEL